MMKLDLCENRYIEDLPISFIVFDVMKDKSGRDACVIRYANKEGERFMHRSSEELIGKDYSEIFPSDHGKLLGIYKDVAVNGGTHQLKRYDRDHDMFVKICVYQLAPGSCACVMTQITDYVDELTGCYTLDGFKIRAEELLDEDSEQTYAFWCCDLKRLKYINEYFGYVEGDRILRFIVNYLMGNLRPDEIVGRITGGKFIIMTHFSEDFPLMDYFYEVMDPIGEYKTSANRYCKIEISCGICVCSPQDRSKRSIDQFIDYAAAAQNAAKEKKGTCVELFEDSMWEKEKRQMEISYHLKEAMENAEIRPWFQPQYDYRAGKIVGAEVLARWVHPTYGNIYPGEFIPVLEKTGQILKLDRYIWECACACIKEWCDQGYEMPLSINLSRKDVMGIEIDKVLLEMTKKYQIDHKLLHLEITESAYIDDADKLIQTVIKLKEAGFHVEMDDFGSGFSSLNMLKEVPISTIKLDMRFLSGIEENSKGGNIVSFVIRMAHGMNMSVIAEGVETKQQADFLKNLGCDFMQGYYFSKPIPRDEFEQNCLFENKIASKNRCETEEKEADSIHELLTVDNTASFIFNRCVGAAAVLEYTQNGILQIMLANDRFFEMNGGNADEIDTKQGSSSMVSAQDAFKLGEAAWRAIECGEARCEVMVKMTGKRVRIRYFLISKEAFSHILFCQMEDI